jgi:hypothetical protein
MRVVLMSRGLGRIERTILAHIVDVEARRSVDPQSAVHLHSWELLCGLYPSANYTFTPAQRKAVIRALHSFVRKHQRFALAGGQGRKMLYLYEPDDPISTMWAKLSLAYRP